MLEKNLTAIEKYNPQLAKLIRYHIPIGKYEFKLAASSDVILFYENYPLHSTVDPQKEALEVFNSISSKDKSTIHLVYGLGLGYLFKRVYLSSAGRILLYESNLDILKITLENVDFSEELSNERVMLIHDKTDLEKAFYKYYLDDDPVNICFLEAYKLIYWDRIQEMSQELAYLRGFFNNNYYALFESSREWFEMSLSNYHEIFKCHYIDIFKDKFKDIPAIIIAAGPSLQKNIHQVKQIENKALIFAVGNALRFIKEKHNIHPHFTAFIDSSEKTLEQLKNVNNVDELNVILQPYTYSGIFAKHFRNKFVYLPTNDFFSNWLAQKSNIDNTSYTNRGTVSMAAFYAAVNFGCNPIIFVGQDLAYTEDGLVYADNDNNSFYNKDDILYIDGWNGKKVPTNTNFAVFKRYFDNLAKEFGNRLRIINATEGGALIDGLEHLTLAEASKDFSDLNLNLHNFINNYKYETFPNPLLKNKIALMNAIKDNSSSLKKLEEQIKFSQEQANKILKELSKPDINKNYILSLFSKLYETNGKIDKIINQHCQLIIPYIQRENFAFVQKFSRHKDFSSVEDLNDYLSLTKNYHDAIINNIPNLKECINISIRGNKDESSNSESKRSIS